MTARSRYAEGTTVSPEKTQVEIGVLLTRICVEGRSIGEAAQRSHVEFQLHGRLYRMGFAIPSLADFRRTPGGKQRTGGQAVAAHGAEVRRLWRCLKLLILSKIEVIESGISDYETELLPYAVMPTGETMAEWALPQLALSAGRDMALLLPAGRSA